MFKYWCNSIIKHLSWYAPADKKWEISTPFLLTPPSYGSILPRIIKQTNKQTRMIVTTQKSIFVESVDLMQTCYYWLQKCSSQSYEWSRYSSLKSYPNHVEVITHFSHSSMYYVLSLVFAVIIKWSRLTGLLICSEMKGDITCFTQITYWL